MTQKIGDVKEALAAHQKSLALRRELAAVPGADVETRLDVARSLHATGSLLLDTGAFAGALAAFQEQRDLAAALEAESPTDAVLVQLAFGYNGIGFVQHQTGKLAEALGTYRKALAIYQKLPESGQYHDPGQGPKFGVQLQADTHNSIGVVLALSGKPADGIESFRKASDIMQKLADANPANNNVQGYLADSYGNFAIACMQLGRLPEALEACRKCMAIAQRLVDDNPAVTAFQEKLCWSQLITSLMLGNTGKTAEALDTNRKALAIAQKLVDTQPSITYFQYWLAVTHNHIGILHSRTGKPAEALAAYRRALPIQKKLVEANPADSQSQGLLSDIHNNIGLALGRQRLFAEAFVAFDAGLGIRLKLLETDPQNPDFIENLFPIYTFRGSIRVRAGLPDEAAADLRHALELSTKLPHIGPQSQFERLRTQALLAGLGADAKSGVTKDEAKSFADQSVAALAVLLKTGWAVPGELKETDFDALRGRPDFQRLVAEVEAKAELLSDGGLNSRVAKPVLRPRR